MVTRLSARAIPGIINHLLDHAPWLRRQAIQLTGKPVQLNLAGIGCTCEFDPWGKLIETNAPAQASITLPATLLLRLAIGDTGAQRDVQLDGDPNLAIEFGRLLGQLSWDAEADFAHLIGVVPAHFLVNSARKISQWKQGTGVEQLLSLVEYHQEESFLLAKRAPLQTWSRQVDTLRDDCARLEQRLALLEQHTHSVLTD